MSAKILSQCDPLWAATPINHTASRIGPEGCLLTSLCNQANQLKCQMNWRPDTLNEAFMQLSIYKSPPYANQIDLARVPLAFQSYYNYRRIQCRTRPATESELDQINLSLNMMGVIVEVQSHDTQGKPIQHFPLIVSVFDGDPRNYLIADPWDGRLKLLSAYKNQWGSDAKSVIMSIVLYDVPGLG